MNPHQQSPSRSKTLPRRLHLSPAVAFSLCVCFFPFGTGPAQPTSRLTPKSMQTLPIRGLPSGSAALRQQGHATLLAFTPPGAAAIGIPLTYPGTYPHSTVSPFAAVVIAQSAGRFLIFTDSFASNAGNIQGECGASETGERFLHVVSLVQPARETFSAIIESCLLDITPSPRTPTYNAAAHTLTFRLHQDDHDTSHTLHIEPNGVVTPSAK